MVKMRKMGPELKSGVHSNFSMFNCKIFNLISFSFRFLFRFYNNFLNPILYKTNCSFKNIYFLKFQIFFQSQVFILYCQISVMFWSYIIFHFIFSNVVGFCQTALINSDKSEIITSFSFSSSGAKYF